jgi:hypothetical protein
MPARLAAEPGLPIRASASVAVSIAAAGITTLDASANPNSVNTPRRETDSDFILFIVSSPLGDGRDCAALDLSAVQSHTSANAQALANVIVPKDKLLPTEDGRLILNQLSENSTRFATTRDLQREFFDPPNLSGSKFFISRCGG